MPENKSFLEMVTATFTSVREANRAYKEIDHCIYNASKTTVTLPSGEQFQYRGNVTVAGEFDKITEIAEHGTINYAERKQHERNWLGETGKSRCAYCGALTVDDSRGNCGACGGPR